MVDSDRFALHIIHAHPQWLTKGIAPASIHIHLTASFYTSILVGKHCPHLVVFVVEIPEVMPTGEPGMSEFATPKYRPATHSRICVPKKGGWTIFYNCWSNSTDCKGLNWEKMMSNCSQVFWNKTITLGRPVV